MAKSCVNIFKPSARKEIFGVVLSESQENVGGLQCVLSEDQKLV